MPNQSSLDVATILELEQKLARAWLDGDRAFIETLLAPDWAIIDVTGRVLTKEQVLTEAFVSSDRQIKTMVIDDVKVRVFGNAAVAIGRTRASGVYQGHDVFVVLRFTDVFVRGDAGWQVVASQGTVVS